MRPQKRTAGRVNQPLTEVVFLWYSISCLVRRGTFWGRRVSFTQPIRRGAHGAAVANLQASLPRLPRRQVIRISYNGRRALEKAPAPALRDRVCKTRSAKLIALLQKPFASRPGRYMDREHARARGLP
jgi:hypothetical protein